MLQPRTQGSLCNPGYEVEIVTAMRDAKDFYGSAYSGLSIEDVQLEHFGAAVINIYFGAYILYII